MGSVASNQVIKYGSHEHLLALDSVLRSVNTSTLRRMYVLYCTTVDVPRNVDGAWWG